MATSKPSVTSNGTVLRGWRQQREYMTYLSLSAIAVYYMRIVPDSFNVSDQMVKIIESGRFTQTGMSLRREYTGIPSLDYGLSFLVVAFTPFAAGFDQGAYWQALHFLLSFGPVVSIWAVESCRRGNERAMVSFTAIWVLFYQTVGGAIIIPLFYLAYTYTSARPNYFSPASQAVPINQARTLLPALLLGFYLPTALVFVPWQTPETTQLFVALWQPCPLYVNALHWIFTKLAAFLDPSSTAAKQTTTTAADPPVHVHLKHLQRTYITSLVLSALAHVTVMIKCLSSPTSTNPHLSLSYVFVPQQSRGHAGLAQALHFIFQIDWWVIFLATLLWCVQALWDLTSMGRTSVSWLRVRGLVALSASVLVLGPGATLSAVWWWRERKLLGGGVVQRGGKTE